jgi:GNAT superfamily N-acetyltransferase
MIKITRAKLEDISVIVPLFDAYRCWYHQTSDVKAAQEFLIERLRNDQSVIFIAWKESKAVGFTQLYPIYSSVSMRTAWLLNDLYVDASVRKEGVGTKLLDAAKAFGTEQKSKWLMLQTGCDNTTAQSVYEKHGWKKETDFFYTLDVEVV